jgi:hypothetical protein
VTYTAEVLACLPQTLDPVSQKFLDHWLSGFLSTPEFLRFFHLPNSDYLPVAQCLLSTVTGA